MKSLRHVDTGLILLSIFLALSIELFAPVRDHVLFLLVGGTLGYFFLGWILRKRNHQKIPVSVLFSGLSFLLMSAVLTTGGLSSIFYPLLFILAFLAIVIFDGHEPLVFLTSAAVALWAVAGTTGLELKDWILLGSLVAILPMSILAEQLKQMTTTLKSVSAELSNDKLQTTVLISTFVLPKLRVIHQLVDAPQENQDGIKKQLKMIMLELEQELQPDEE